MARKRQKRPVITNAAASTPPRVSKRSTAIAMPASWTEFETGPYSSIPTVREGVIDGYLMSRYDSTVGSVLTIIKELVLSKLGRYSNPDETVEAFINETLGDLEDGMRNTVGAMMSCLWAGFSVSEKVWETDGSSWRIRSINLLHPLTFFDRYSSKVGIVYDPKVGGVSEFVQMRQTMNDQNVSHRPEDVVYWPLQRELREEVFGRRLTDRARRSWYMKSRIEIYWSVYLERFASPTPIFMIPRGSVIDETGREITNSEFYASAIGNLGPGNGMAVEVGPEENYEFKLMESSNSGEGYEKSLQYHNAEIFKSLLMSPLLLEEPQNGSRAQANTALDMFLLIVEAIRSELGAVLIDQVVKPMIRFNFGENVELGEWKFDELADEDLKLMSEVLLNVANSKAIVFRPEDEARIRGIYGDAGLEDMDEIDLTEQPAAPPPITPPVAPPTDQPAQPKPAADEVQ